MDNRRHTHRRRRRSWRKLLIPAGALLLSLLLASSRPPAPIAGPGEDAQGSRLAEDTALLVQPEALTPPAQKGVIPERARDPASQGADDAERWKLILVNRWEPLPEDYTIRTVELRNGFQVDERCYPDLQDMMDACRAEGLSPLICSAYRTWDYQEELFQSQVSRLTAQGYSRTEAEREAGRSVAVPGTSEHQLGLAVDIVDTNYQKLDSAQEDTAVQQWLISHSWEYGFILRYPSDKSKITGIIYEPWHYRYVGREYARQIYTLDICLEEYLQGGF